MEIHDITLNIHYTAPKELWLKLNELYKDMPYWYGYIDSIPTWYNFDGKIIDVSVEPGGLQFYAELSQKEWDTWISEFKKRATKIMGYEVGEVENGYECKVYERG